MLLLAGVVAGVVYILFSEVKRDVRGVRRREIIGGARVAVKSDVNTDDIDPVMGTAIDVARSVGLSPVVTSALRPADRGSLHKVGRALDFRTRHLADSESRRVASEMQNKLGDDWDVIAEFNPNHIHVEYDPN